MKNLLEIFEGMFKGSTDPRTRLRIYENVVPRPTDKKWFDAVSEDADRYCDCYLGDVTVKDAGVAVAALAVHQLLPPIAIGLKEVDGHWNLYIDIAKLCDGENNLRPEVSDEVDQFVLQYFKYTIRTDTLDSSWKIEFNNNDKI